MPNNKPLPEAQQAVLDLAQRGKTPDEIAAARGVSVNAVYQTLSRLRNRGMLPSSSKPKRGRPRGRPRKDTPERKPILTGIEAVMASAEREWKRLDDRALALQRERATLVERIETLDREIQNLVGQAESIKSVQETIKVPVRNASDATDDDPATPFAVTG